MTNNDNLQNQINLDQKAEINHSKPLVTVVTVTYNLINAHREKMIDQCIRSVCEQTYENIEHIIIDGASDDGTLDFLKNYEDNVVIYSEKDNGVYDAMNKGISKAAGKYVAFLNSDDYYSDNRAVEYSVERLEMCDADYSFSDVLILYEDETTYRWIADINNLPYATHYCHQSMLVKTEILKKYHGFSDIYKVSADSDLMIRLYKDKYKYVYIPKLLINYRDGGLSEKNKEESRHDHAYSFYENIGKNMGLTETECLELWQFGFLKNMPKEQRIDLLEKVSTEFNVDHVQSRALKERSLIRKAADGLIDKKIIIIRRKKSRNKRLLIAYLGGKIPCFVKISKM